MPEIFAIQISAYLGCCVIASDREFSCHDNVGNESENPMCCNSNMYRDLAKSLSLSDDLT